MIMHNLTEEDAHYANIKSFYGSSLISEIKISD